MKNGLSKPLHSGTGDYNIFKAIDSMGLLKSVFPDGEANVMNFVLFSTSGVHGTYKTIEEEEKKPGIGVTFVIVQPRVVTMQYGVVKPRSREDFTYLKKLRNSSQKAVMNIGI